MIRLFAGFDPREEVGYHAFCSSVIHQCSEPVSIAPLHLAGLGKVYSAGQRDGSNAFAFSRFLIPYLLGYSGMAIFMDGADMVVRGDLAELARRFDPFKAVQVVQHSYQTRHPRKYVGTGMEADNRDYPRKNWSSVMLINCAHYAWRRLTPSVVESMSGADLHRFGFIEERFIGELPAVWNWLVDEYGPSNDAKVLHWTAGIPAFEHYNDAPMAAEWHTARERITHAIA